MNRVLMVFSFSALAGILLQQNVTAIVTILAILCIVQVLLYFKKKRLLLVPVLIGLSVGFLCTPNESELVQYADQPVRCTVEVNGKPQVESEYAKFTGIVHDINGTPVHEKTLVYVYGKHTIRENTLLELEDVVFKLPSEQQNFGGFDYKQYLSSKEIYTIVKMNSDSVCSVKQLPMTVSRLAVRANVWLCDRIEKIFDDSSAGLLKGILLGDKTDLPGNAKTDFKNSGLSHVLAVSGLHLTILVSLLGIFLKALSRPVRNVILLVFIWGFAFVVGLPVSVLRAATMLSVLLIAECLRWESDSLTNLSFIAVILLLINPNTVYDTGFVMSFSATLGLLCITPVLGRHRPSFVPKSVWECISVTVAAQIGTLPFMVMQFGAVSLVAVPCNLILSVLMPLIYGTVFLALLVPFTATIPQFLLHMLSAWAKFWANLPGAMLYVPQNKLLTGGIFGITVICLLSQAFKHKKYMAWLLCICTAFCGIGWYTAIKPPENTTIIFINVGQADSALLQTSDGGTFLIDTGTAYSGENEVVPYLHRQGVLELDGVFLSHFDSDHMGGIYAILDHFRVQALYIPDTQSVGQAQYDLLMYAKDKHIPVHTLLEGDVIKTNRITFSVLAPQQKLADDDNECSMVLRAENKDAVAVFAGDLQDESNLKNCNADILKVSHHGSKNGSKNEFLNKCTPKIAVISLGLDNRYGFPHADTLNRLQKHTDKIYRTDKNGTVQIQCNQKQYAVRTLR